MHGGLFLSEISLADQAAKQIRELILQNNLPPGKHINISNLARTFGFSQTPVREALKKLISEGLVVYKSKIGYAVRALSLHEYLQVSEIHKALEIYLVRELAPMPSLIDFEALYDVNRKMARFAAERRLDDVAEMNDVFHRKLYEHYHNHLLVSRLFSLWNEVRSQRNIMYNSSVFIGKIAREHEQILQALEAQNPDAAATAMEIHYKSGLDGAIMSFPVAEN